MITLLKLHPAYIKNCTKYNNIISSGRKGKSKLWKCPSLAWNVVYPIEIQRMFEARDCLYNAYYISFLWHWIYPLRYFRTKPTQKFCHLFPSSNYWFIYTFYECIACSISLLDEKPRSKQATVSNLFHKLKQTEIFVF